MPLPHLTSEQRNQTHKQRLTDFISYSGLFAVIETSVYRLEKSDRKVAVIETHQRVQHPWFCACNVISLFSLCARWTHSNILFMSPKRPKPGSQRLNPVGQTSVAEYVCRPNVCHLNVLLSLKRPFTQCTEQPCNRKGSVTPVNVIYHVVRLCANVSVIFSWLLDKDCM